MNNIFILFLIFLIFYCACGNLYTEKFVNLNKNWINFYNCNRNNFLQQGISDKITNDCDLNQEIKLNKISTKNLPYLINKLPLDESKNYVNYDINPFGIYKINNDNKFYKKMSEINQCKQDPFITSLKNNYKNISCNKLY